MNIVELSCKKEWSRYIVDMIQYTVCSHSLPGWRRESRRWRWAIFLQRFFIKPWSHADFPCFQPFMMCTGFPITTGMIATVPETQQGFHTGGMPQFLGWYPLRIVTWCEPQQWRRRVTLKLGGLRCLWVCADVQGSLDARWWPHSLLQDGSQAGKKTLLPSEHLGY